MASDAQSSGIDDKARKRKFALVAGLIGAILALVVCELGLRLLLHSPGRLGDLLRQPWRYAHPTYDSDYWKLAYLWKSEGQGYVAGTLDRDLGWLPPTSEGNPYGLHMDQAWQRVRPDCAVLFFGDSFVAGVTEMQDRIPQLLDKALADRSVLNLGVSGYGLDQIYLRYRKIADEFPTPVILIGILMDDLNRTVLEFRGGQKPYFELHDGELRLRNVPIEVSNEEFLRRHPPEFVSYLWRFLIFRLSEILPQGVFDMLTGYGKVKQQRETVNRRLLQAFVENAQERQLDLFFVLFYSGEEMRYVGWHESFVKTMLTELDAQFVDTKPYLLKAAQERNVELEELYADDLGHPNAVGNQVIAAQVQRVIEAHATRSVGCEIQRD